MPLPSPYLPNYSAQSNQLAELGQMLGQNRRTSRLSAALPGALKGDQSQMQAVYDADPSVGLQAQQHVDQQAAAQQKQKSLLNEQNRERMRESLVRAAGTIVNLPETELPMYWGRIRADLVKENPELADSLPMEYDPTVGAMAKSIAAKEGILPESASRGSLPGSIQEFEYGQQNPQYLEFLNSRGSQPGPESFGAPVPVMGENGPELIQYGNRGSVRPTGQSPAAWDPSAVASLEYAKGDAKRQVDLITSFPKATSSLESTTSKNEFVIDKIDETLPMVSAFTAGIFGQTLDSLGGSPQRDLRAQLDTIRANIGFAELQEMRNNSPTGGALGQVTEREIAFLQALMGNLEQSQSAAQLRKNLIAVKEGLQAANSRLAAAYQLEYGSLQGAPQSIRQSAPPQPSSATSSAPKADTPTGMTDEELSKKYGL